MFNHGNCIAPDRFGDTGTWLSTSSVTHHVTHSNTPNGSGFIGGKHIVTLLEGRCTVLKQQIKVTNVI